MPKRLNLAVLLGAAILLFTTLPAAPAAASPWWQVMTGARPTNLWLADQNQVQEIQSAMSEEGFLIAKMEVGGAPIGCLGADIYGGAVVAEYCPILTGFPATETREQLESLLGGPYGTGNVEVTGGPAGNAPLFVTTAWGPYPMVKVVVLEGLGTASAEMISKDSGHLTLTLTNLGDAPVHATTTPLTVTDELPNGVSAYEAEGHASFGVYEKPVSCTVKTASLVNCSFTGTIEPFEAIEIEVYAALTSTMPGEGKVTVSGGDGPSAEDPQRLTVSRQKTPFGFQTFSSQAESEGGTPVRQAGSHPFQFTNTIQVNQDAVVAPKTLSPIREAPALPRNFRFELPAGLVGNATAVEQCSMRDFLAISQGVNQCPAASAIGVAAVTFDDYTLFGLGRFPVPVFNLPPAEGEPARFGFVIANDPVLIDTSLETEDGYRITASVHNATQVAVFLASTVTLWGVPADSRHDASRGWGCVYPAHPGGCSRPAELKEAPFLRMPVSCRDPLLYPVEMEPWNVPLGSDVVKSGFESVALDDCNRVPFDPEIQAAPTSKLAENPSGLDFELNMPNSGLENPSEGAVAEGQPKKVEVSLPEGVTVNPSEAEGLAVCTEADYKRETAESKPGEGCPEASKIGSVEIETPLLEEKPHGALYLAKPHENPFGSLLALYMVAKIPDRGILVKQAGEVKPDPKTGQLVTTFDNLPQLPFSSFRLHFREGGRAPLVTPPACGTYSTVAKFVPWSAQDPDNPTPNEIVERTAPFTIEHGVDGGACPAGGTPPFQPGFTGGTMSNSAGRYSPFYMRLTRKDGDQELTRFSAALPPGLSAKLAGVPECSDAAIAAAKAKSGTEELAAPSCPAASRIGSIDAGVGVGSVLTYVSGKLYLAEPFAGAPLSVVSIVPAVGGPFDIGTVVTREALQVDSETAEVHVDGAHSDPIPHILAGIPVRVRDIRVHVDRHDFTLNPTSCERMTVEGTLWGGGLNVFSGADDVPVSLSQRFQAASCANLGFKPKLSLRLFGKAHRNAHPKLRAVLTMPKANQANIARAAVALPHSEFLDQGHIRTVCTRVQFAAGQCPAASIYGYAKAWTPLLDQPLEGPVYLRSSSHNLPDLVADLNGQIAITLVGRIDSINGGIRTSFEAVPDAPVSKFMLTMKGGSKGLLVNSTNICAKRYRATAKFDAHSGAIHDTEPLLKNSACGRQRR